MKKKNTFARFLSTAFAVVTVATSFAQTNLGASCGCPPVASRPTKNLSAISQAIPAAPNTVNEAWLDTNRRNVILTCDTTWILDKRLYVKDGRSLTIRPGTVIKGKKYSTPDSSAALFITRGAQIFADGTASCPIVFTAFNDPMNGTYGVNNRGQWGGLVILGKAKNNLTFAKNGVPGAGRLCISDGVGYIEGFNGGNGRNYFGGTDDDDNSGILKYVSVRHAGDIIAAGNELNAISLGSVGRGTTIDHVEVISSDDDGFEFFGGTVNVKYCAAMFGADDGFDWDLGYRGNGQFLVVVQADSVTTPTADNGFEADNDDQSSGNKPKSLPVFANATFISNGSKNLASDNSGHAAIMAKDGTNGEIYNSIFANFKLGFNMRTSGPFSCVDNWFTKDSLKVKCNTFLPGSFNANHLTINQSMATVTAAQNTKFTTTDGNTTPGTIAGFDFSYVMNTSTNAVTDSYNLIPTAVVSTTCPTPTNGAGFFSPAAYRGAFKIGEKSWLSDWSYGVLVKTTPGLIPCPTDINNDGKTDNADFLSLVGQFGQSCK